MAGFNNNYMGMEGQSVVLAAAQTDNLALTSTIATVTPQNDGDAITGAIPPALIAGLFFLVNIHPTRSLVLPYDSASSDVGYRWLNILGHDLTVEPGQTAQFAFVPGLGWEFINPAVLV